MTKPRVLMVIQQFRPIVGGAEKQAEALAQELTRQGCPVEILTGRWLPQTRREERLGDVRVRRIFAAFGAPKISQAAFLLRLMIFLARHAREYDVIHFHQALRMTALGSMVARLRGVPCIAKTGSSGVTSDLKWLKGSPMGGLLLRGMRCSLDRLVCTSELAYEEALEFGFSRERLTRIPNGVAIPEQALTVTKSGTPTLLYVGRLSHEKGVDILLRASAELAKTTDFDLKIIGDGALRADLERLAGDLGIAARVRWLGEVSRPSEHFTSDAIFVLPSRSEGMSNALLEALSAGLPAVVTRVGSNEELSAEGQAALVVEPENPMALAETIAQVISQGLSWKAEQVRTWISERYSITAVALRYSELYGKLAP